MQVCKVLVAVVLQCCSFIAVTSCKFHSSLRLEQAKRLRQALETLPPSVFNDPSI